MSVSDSDTASSGDEEALELPTLHRVADEDAGLGGGRLLADADSSDAPAHAALRTPKQRRAFLVLCAALLAIATVIAAVSLTTSYSGADAQTEAEESARFLSLALERPSATGAKATMHSLTAYNTMAGTEGGNRSAYYVAETMREAGWETEFKRYRVLLAYPVEEETGVSLVTPAASAFDAATREPPLPEDPTSSRDDASPAFIAYSANGNVTAEVVYVNYGRKEDFELLRLAGVPLEGRVALARYGRIFRGLKAMIAQEYNMSACLIYSDPQDDGEARGDVYPAGPWRSRHGIQRGGSQFISLHQGDPLTPGVAALDEDGFDAEFTWPSRDPPEPLKRNSLVLPSIPIQPLCWDDAARFLGAMGGTAAADMGEDWAGGIPGVTYRLGQVPAGETMAEPPVVARVRVTQSFAKRTIVNVISRLPGREGSTNQVVLGGHRDAWVFGAVDPHSGSSTLIEAARALGSAARAGWRPRRSLVVASWDAEEFGLVGSVEWVEENAHELTRGTPAVAYVNVDAAVTGTDAFLAQASPSLSALIRDAAERVRTYADAVSGSTVATLWNATLDDVTGSGLRQARPLGSGSDYAGFLQFLGVACADVRFGHGYGQYHSIYDSEAFMERFGDPTMERHSALARVVTYMAFRLADDLVVPLNASEYGATVAAYARRNLLIPDATLAAAPPLFVNTTLAALARAADAFQSAANVLQAEAYAAAQTRDPAAVERVNRRLIGLESHFIDAATQPDRGVDWYRHALYAPARYEGYSAAIAPGVTEAVAAGDWDDAAAKAGEIERVLRSAASALRGGEGREES